MTKWEYKTVNLRVEQKRDKSARFFSLIGFVQDLKDGSETELASLGDEGWELVSVMPVDAPGIASGTLYAIAFFKRPKS